MTENHQIRLAARPAGAPTARDFDSVYTPLPVPTDGQVQVRNVYLSLDPYMRGRMSAAKSYADPVAIGDVMVGATVGQVERSIDARFAPGDWVLGMGGWQTHAVLPAEGLMKLDPARAPLSWALGVLGMPGYTAYMGLMDIGKPKAGETLVVGAATGPVGATVGQIGKIKGCRVVGVAGGAKKCRHAVDVLGFDACIDHRAPDFVAQLAAACPQGVDIYFENVGGAVFDAVMPLLNTSARIPLCGVVSQYNWTELPPGPDRLGAWMGQILAKRMTVRGFIIMLDYGPAHYAQFAGDMAGWLVSGQVRYTEQLVQGLDAAPEALIGLLEGRNFGKVVVQIGPEQSTSA